MNEITQYIISKIKKVNGHIFVFGEMGQNYGAKSLVFVSSCSLKTRELSFAQFSLYTLISLINVEPRLTDFEKFHPPRLLIS